MVAAGQLGERTKVEKSAYVQVLSFHKPIAWSSGHLIRRLLDLACP